MESFATIVNVDKWRTIDEAHTSMPITHSTMPNCQERGTFRDFCSLIQLNYDPLPPIPPIVYLYKLLFQKERLLKTLARAKMFFENKVNIDTQGIKYKHTENENQGTLCG